MNFESMKLMESIEKLESTITNPGAEQAAIFSDIKAQIRSKGSFYEVTALSVALMRAHGYDVTEQDAGIMRTIADKVEIDSDMLWEAVEIWADYYNIKRIDEDNISNLIDILFTQYVEEHDGQEPRYANCTIYFSEDASEHKVVIKLSSGVTEGSDDHIFFYCNSLTDMKFLTSVGVEDFIITEINSFE